MRNRWLTTLLASWLASGSLFATEDPLPVSAVSAILPKATNERDRPTELPNIDSRLDIKPLVKPTQTPPPPSRDRRRGPDYDPSYVFLPERNPGTRQPPCPCLPLGRSWLNAAYFLGKTQNDSAPALVTANGSVIYGNERLDHPFRSGLRVEGGAWLDRCQNWGIDGSFFLMQSTSAQFSTSSDGTTSLGRPFVGQPGNTQTIDLLAGPGVGRGSISIDSPLTFLGADLNARGNLFCEDNVRLDFLGGFRAIRMSEDLDIRARRENISEVNDSFRTLNMFTGGQVGFAGEFRYERVYVAGSTKLAFGATWSRLEIESMSRSQATGALTDGLLARPTNSGKTSDRQFAVVPEANFSLGYQLFDHWRAFAGYTFVYLSSVARPGQAVDTNIGGAFPRRLEPNTDFWMHGINLGMEARY